MKLIVILFSLLSVTECANAKKAISFSQNEMQSTLELNGTYIIESKGNFTDMLKVVDYVVELQRPNS